MLDSSIFLLIYFSGYLFFINRSIRGFIFKVNPISFFLLFYFVRNHVGLILMFFSTDGFKQLDAININTLTEMAIYNIVFMIFCILIYTALVSLFKDNSKVNTQNNSPLKYRESVNIFFILYLFIAIFLSFDRFFNDSPLFLALSDMNMENATKYRLQSYVEGYNYRGIPLGYVNAFMLGIDIIFLYYISLYWEFRKKKYLLICLFVFIIGVIWSMSNASKGYIMVPVILSWLSYSYICNKQQISFYYIAKYAPFLMVISSLLAYYVLNNSSIYWIYPIERFLVGNLVQQYLIFDNFNLSNMLYGTSLPSWYSLGAHEQFSLSEWSWRETTGRFNSELYYHNPSSLVAEAYANFNIFGLPIYGFIFSTYIWLYSKLIYVFFSKKSYMISIIYLSYYFSKYSVREFGPQLLDYRLWAILIFIFIFFSIKNRKGRC